MDNTNQPDADLTPVDESTPAATPDVAPAAEAKRPDDAEIQRLLAEAEQRGYLRGRNEQIDALIMNPDRESMPDEFCSLCDDDDNSCPGFLANIRPDFWD